MRTTRENSLLLGALLDRLGTIQGQTLLARLDQWLSQDHGFSVESIAFDRNQIRAIEPAYDRRKPTKSGTPDPNFRTAS